MAVDIVAFLACSYVSYMFRVTIKGSVDYPSSILWSALAWVGIRWTAGLYPGYGLLPPEELRRAVLTTVIAALAHTASLFAFKATDVSRLVTLTTWLLIVPAAWAGRTVVKAALLRKGWFGTPVVILGAGPWGQRVVREMKQQPSMGFVPIAFYDDDLHKVGKEIEGIPVRGTLMEALTETLPHRVERVIVAIPSLTGEALQSLVGKLSLHYRYIGVITDLLGVGNLWARTVSLGTTLGLEIQNNLMNISARRWKRAFDIIVAVLLSPVALFVIALAAIAVMLVSPGNPFYAQLREGLGGRPIRVWKIRTMYPDADARLERYLSENPAASEEWYTRFKLRQDPRVLPVVGRLLRRFSIDEWPQLWNVLCGEMSLVGPRPFPEYHLAQFPEDFRRLRRLVPPGITGLWQVASRSDGDLQTQMEMDAYYIRNWSIWLDLWILIRTLGAVIRGDGAY